jgi:hypothetical protein
MYNKESNNNNLRTMDRKFSDALFEFISSVESEIDIVLPHPASVQFLCHSKVVDRLISQKLSKNVIVRLLSTYDESTSALIKKIIPFIDYKSIKPSSHITAATSSASSLVLIRDKQDIFSFSIDILQYGKENLNDSILSVNDWLYSRNVSLVKNSVHCFDIIWREKDNYDEVLKDKKHSELLVDLITHDIRNYHQIIQTSVGLVISLLEKNKTSILSPDSEKMSSLLTTAENALVRSQSFVDNVRRLQRLYTQKGFKINVKEPTRCN